MGMISNMYGMEKHFLNFMGKILDSYVGIIAQIFQECHQVYLAK